LVGSAALTLIAIVLNGGKTATLLEFRELINDGQPKYGPILSNRSRLYFAEDKQDFARIVSVPVTGVTSRHCRSPWSRTTGHHPRR